MVDIHKLVQRLDALTSDHVARGNQETANVLRDSGVTIRELCRLLNEIAVDRKLPVRYGLKQPT